MISTDEFTNYKRSKFELEELVMFGIAVAGKNAANTARALDKFFRGLDANTIQPLTYIKYLQRKDLVRKKLEESRIGKYGLLEKGFTQLANSGLNLEKCTVEDLEKIHGVGQKTSRMVILHSRPKVKLAVLDVHILKHMKSLGFDVPKVTPSGKKYLEIEKQFLQHCDEEGVKNIAEYDLELWKQYRRG